MKHIRSIVVIAGALLVMAAMPAKADVYVDGKRVELGCSDVYLESIQGCPTPTFHPADENQDGVLDDVCVGLEYDPCNMEGSVWWAYVQRGQTGEACQTKEEVAADCAVDFSPLPPKCRRQVDLRP